MARNRSYDEDAVLSGAMHAFRRKGYQALSIGDLEKATGLKAGSIYNSFGDKAGLFDAAFTHYLHTVVQGRLDRYAPEGSGIAGLRALFLSLLHEPDGTSYGCLLTTMAVESGGSGSMHPRVAEGLRIQAETFVQRLVPARGDGHNRESFDPQIAADRLLALYQGVLVLVRAGFDKAALERLINDEFNHLENGYDD